MVLIFEDDEWEVRRGSEVDSVEQICTMDILSQEHHMQPHQPMVAIHIRCDTASHMCCRILCFSFMNTNLS